MKSTIFRTLANYLDTQLNNQIIADVYGKVNYIARWNNQLQRLQDEDAITFPAIFIEFPNSDWYSKTNNQQKGEMTVRIRVVQHNEFPTNKFAKQTDFNEGMKRDEYIQVIHNLLQGITVASGTMQRKSMIEDNNHDHLMMDIIDYVADVEDTCADPRNSWITKSGTDLNVENDQELTRPGAPSSPYVFDLSNKI